MINAYDISLEARMARSSDEAHIKPSNPLFSLAFAEYLGCVSRGKKILAENPEVADFVRQLDEKFPDLHLSLVGGSDKSDEHPASA